MATPLSRAAHRHIMASGIPEKLIMQNLLGIDPDGKPYDRARGGWLFAGESEGDPFRSVEGTSRCAVVIYNNSEWAIPSRYRTSQYPNLHLTVFADPTRDDDGQPIAYDAEDKAFAVWRALHPLFHDAANKVRSFPMVQDWYAEPWESFDAASGALRVLSTVQGGQWSSMGVPDGDGSVRGDCTYNLHL